MNYSDEPNVVSEQARSKKTYFVVGGLILFLGLLASVVFFPRILDFQRRNTPVGPYDGSVYFISLEGDRFSMELARPEEFDFHLHVVLLPVRDNTVWEPENHLVRVHLEGEEAEYLEWDPETSSYGPSVLRFHPMGEFRFDLEIYRGDRKVWSGRRWSFQVGGPPHGH